ncbi:MAG: right-handed parallel beta-helix repeat-containing protein [Euryarchaeota archaeon]|nr:right-handed parallel beta-helix repeat-containing protein [Euryarchaeota archaeon]
MSGQVVVLAIICVVLIPVGVSAENPLGPGQQSRPPIFITNNAMLGVGCVPNLASGVVSGCGTASNPYVIEGWFIEPNPVYDALISSDAIVIRGTTSHVLVRNNTIPIGFANALRIENAQNLRVMDNSLTGSVLVSGSTGIVVETNSISTDDTGIAVFMGSSNVDIIGNGIAGGQVGISVIGANVLLSGNTVSGTTAAGFSIGGSYPNVTISHNLVTNNTGVGIYFTGSAGSVTDNVISNNSGGGLFAGRQGVDYSGNNIFDNLNYGACACSTLEIDLRGNWWGDASGPSGAGSGTGDALLDNPGGQPPLFDPWLTTANGDAGP